VTAEPTHGKSVAVLDFIARQGATTDLAGALTDAFTTNLRATGKFERVVSTSEIRATLNYEMQKQLSQCDQGSCLAEIGGAMGVDYIVTSSVTKVGRLWIVHCSLISSKTGLSDATVS